MFAYSRKKHLIVPFLYPDEQPTLKDMAFSLRDMDKLIMEGKPVSNTNLSNDYYEGVVTNDTSVPLENQRGVDINDVWNASQTSGKLLRKTKLSKVDINPVTS